MRVRGQGKRVCLGQPHVATQCIGSVGCLFGNGDTTRADDCLNGAKMKLDFESKGTKLV